MEKGARCVECGVSDKATSALESDVGLGLKLQTAQPHPLKVTDGDDHHHHRPSSSPETDGDGGGGGPTLPSGANKVVGGIGRSMSYIYHDDLASAIAAARADAAVTTLQPFTATSHTSFKSPAGGMAATLGFPFTSAQWKELERQAMIYKYMLASVPVPSDLLQPMTRNLSAQDPHSPLVSGGSVLGLQYSGNKDPEPGRCKRTDGKKWRCSRDVAPNQKYCDRHMHRGRPRSRKHVEVHSPFKKADNSTTATAGGNKKNRLNHHPLPVSNPPPQNLRSTVQPNEIHLILPKDCDENISASSYKQPNKALDWTMGGEMVSMDASEQQWQQWMQTDIGLTSEGSMYSGTAANCFQQTYRDEALSLLPCTDFVPREIEQRNECALFLKPCLLPLQKEPQLDTPIGFIDAWSNDTTTATNNHNNRADYSVSSQGNPSPSLTLSMAMAATTGIDREMGPIAMGLGVEDSHHGYGIGGVDKSRTSSWLSPVPWSASAPGGPLGEVFRPNSAPAFPYAAGGDSFSNPATTVSSPSGILQRSMLSFSDSSGCNSPTLAASAVTTPEAIAFHRLG